MNWEQVEGNWKQMIGQVRQKWENLTDDDLSLIRGKREQLVGKIQERYGVAKEAAEKQVDEFVRVCKTVKTEAQRKVRNAGR